MSSTTFSALQQKFSQADENPPANSPQVPENTPAQPEAKIPTPDIVSPEANKQEEVVKTEQPKTEDNNGVPDVADFSLSIDGEQPDAPQQPAQQPPSFNLDEEIKKIDRKEMLKKLGVNDFLIGMDEHYSKGGRVDDYVYARGVDYNQVSDEDLVKDDYRKKFPNFSKDEIDRMYNRKFGVTDSMLDEEKEDRLLELKAEGHIKRQERIREQQNFKFPDPLPIKDEAYEQWKQQSQLAQQNQQNNINFYNNHTATKTLNESKRVAINFGEGIQPLKIVVDKPELITRALTDDGTIMNKLMTTQSGEPDVEKEQLFTLFAFNPQKFIQTIFNYGMQQGVYKKLVNDNQNAQKPTAPVLPMSPDAKPVFRSGTYGGLVNR